MNTLGNKEIMAENISFYMEKFGITRKKLSADLDISYTTLTDWIKGKTYPRIDKIEMLANYFKISKSDLVERKEPTTTLTLINDTSKQLTEDRQSNVLEFAQKQLDEQESNIVELEAYRDIAITSKVSAGTGVLDLDPQHAETISYYGKVPNNYDMAFEVSGDSMQPLFEDGEIIFVKATEDVTNSQIAVVQIDDETYIKKVYREDDNLRLVSLNTKYKDIIADKDYKIKFIGNVIL